LASADGRIRASVCGSPQGDTTEHEGGPGVDELFKPVETTGPRPRDPKSTDMLYVRSFLAMRTFIGGLGMLLPGLVVFLDRLL
jgi:hypothetical protein